MHNSEDRRSVRRRAEDQVDASTDLVDLVSRATARALDLRRTRLYGESATIALIVALLVAVPVALLVTNVGNANRQAQARYNCRVITFLAEALGNGGHDPALPRGGFISSDATLRNQQQNVANIIRGKEGPLVSLLRDPNTRRLTLYSNRLNSETTSYWDHTIIPALDRVAQANCRVGN